MDQPSQHSKLFTVEEANALLPIIRPAVNDLLETFQKIRTEIEEAAGQAGVPIESPDLAGHLKARGIVPRLFDKVKSIVTGIHTHGCIVNGPEVGLVDFPCIYQNEMVFLCWKFGEADVQHWHRIPDGFAGRKPLLDPSEAEANSPVH